MDEQVFLATLKKIRWSTNRDDLAAATRTTLQLLLRRPTDKQLLNSLLNQVASITNGLPSNGAGPGASAIRQAAVRCVVLLQEAKRGRLTRAQSDDIKERRRHRQVMLLLAACVAGVAAYLVSTMPRFSGGGQTGIEIAQAMESALNTSRLGLTKRGDITIRATHEHTIVTAERLAPEDCLVAAQKIKSMGTLSINDKEVGRPNDDKLSKLCYEMHDATLAVTKVGYKP